jgi:hypothetical protein
VILLMLYNGVVYQQNSSCGVWKASGSTWVPASFPVDLAPPADVGFTCPGIGGVWVSSSGNKLYSSNQSVNPGWPGPFNFYFDASCSGAAVASSGELSLSQATIGQNPLYVTGSNTATSLTANWGATSNFAPFSYTGELSPGVSLVLSSVDCAGNPTTTIWSYDGTLYNNPATPAMIAGSWSWMQTGMNLTIDSLGNITIPNIEQTAAAGCGYSGSVTVLNPNYNLYEISLSFSQCPSGGYEHGVGYAGLLSVDSAQSPVVLEGGVVTNGNGFGGTGDLYLTRQ